MTNTNYIGIIVKVLENPKQKLLKKTILYVKVRVQFPQMRSVKIAHLVFWGNLAKDVASHYKKNDYILVEGYLAFKNKTKLKKESFIKKKIEITVLKIYPFFFNEDRSLKKL